MCQRERQRHTDRLREGRKEIGRRKGGEADGRTNGIGRQGESKKTQVTIPKG